MVRRSQPKRKCPKCNRGTNSSWIYCPMCGSILDVKKRRELEKEE